eukprot:9066562-Karenia_brevis.AAC.1
MRVTNEILNELRQRNGSINAPEVTAKDLENLNQRIEELGVSKTFGEEYKLLEHRIDLRAEQIGAKLGKVTHAIDSTIDAAVEEAIEKISKCLTQTIFRHFVRVENRMPAVGLQIDKFDLDRMSSGRSPAAASEL